MTAVSSSVVGFVSFVLTCLGLSVLALGALGRRTRRAVQCGGMVLVAMAVLAARGSAPVRLLATGGVTTFALGASLLALPHAPRAVRQLPVIHRVALAVDHVPFPWKPRLAAHVPLAVLAETSLPTLANDGPTPASAPASSPASAPAQTQALATPAGGGTQDMPPAAAASVVETGLPTLPGEVRLEGVKHQWQTWNNCGPATITMAVSYFGRKETQTDALRFLKSNPDDKNVSPHELVSYARSLGLEANWRLGGDLTRLKQLLAHNIPVVVEVWIAPEPNDWMGHYRLLVGYDDKAGRFIAYDSVQQPGPNLLQPYAKFDDDWRVFNRTYIPVYTKEQAPLVERIIGQDRDDKVMYERALAAAQRETLARPDDGFAWFNVGSSLTALGKHAEAAAAFDKARSMKLPWRMLWYQFAPFEAYLATGRTSDVLALANANLQRSADLEESHFYKGKAFQAQGQTAQARAAFQAAVKGNTKYTAAREALASLG